MRGWKGNLRVWRPIARRWGKPGLAVTAILAVGLLAGGGAVLAQLGGAPKASSSADIALTKGLIGWWKLDGNTKDSSPYGNNGTLYGGVTPTADEHGKANGAYSFDGSTGYISLPINTSTMLSGTSESVSVWVKASNSNAAVFSSGWNKRLFNGNWSVYDSGNTIHNINTPGITDNKWHQVAYTYDGANLKGYVDGRVVSTVPVTGTLRNNDTYWWLGQMCSGSTCGQYFTGSIDDFRIYNRPLSASEMAALYSGYNSQLSSATGENGLVGWWKFDGNAKDATPNGNNGSLIGSPPLTVDRKGTPNSAYSFNGSSMKIDIPDTTILDPTQDMTVAAWIRPGTASQASNARVVAKYDGTNANYLLAYNDTTGQMRFVVDGSSRTTALSTTLLTNTNQWYYIVGVRTGSTLQIWINGALEGTAAISGSNKMAVGAPIEIGGRETGTYYNGAIDDVRVYNRALSSSEVIAQYTSYDSQIAIGGSPGSSVQLGRGLVGDWPMNGNAKDATPYGNNGTVTAATLTTDRKGRANSAYNFNGTGQYISANLSGNLTNNYTISAWVNRTNTATGDPNNTGGVLGGNMCNSSASIEFLTSNTATPQIGLGRCSDISTIYSSGTFNVGAWAHLVVTVDASNNVTYYINGNNAGGFSGGALNLSLRSPVIISDNALRNFIGSIDDVRIWNRALNSAEVTALYHEYR